MKLPVVAFLFYFPLSTAWQIDPRCPGYEAALARNSLRNDTDMTLILDTNATTAAADDHMMMYPDNSDPNLMENDVRPQDIVPIDDVEFSHATSTLSSQSSSLRGPSHRDLQQYSFQLRMYWEEGYCWQEEWIERRWCLECQGSSCNEKDYLWLKPCGGSKLQKFIYEEISGSGGGRLKPYTDQNLCYERTRTRAHQLMECRDTSKQIIIGFDRKEKFEMHPYGQPDKCLENPHHPKRNEIIRAGDCESSRSDKTSYWIVTHHESLSPTSLFQRPPAPPPPTSPPKPTTSPPKPTSPPSSGRQAIRDMGREYCDKNKCDLCEGDCDSDSQCRGKLKCFRRDAFDEVPGCSGGGSFSAGTDFCIDTGDGGDDDDDDNGGGGKRIDDRGGDYCNGKKGRRCGLCEGDCDNDDDCEGSLKCFQRDGPGISVPGCKGGSSANSKTDFCYDDRR